MAEEWKEYDGCKIGYYDQLLDTVRIQVDYGTVVQIPYAAIESFVSDVLKEKAIAQLQSSEDFLSELYNHNLVGADTEDNP